MNFDLSQIRPDAISAYLAANNWTDCGAEINANDQPLLRFWSREDVEVAVPLRADFRDYVRRVTEVVDALRSVEKRDAAEIASDLVNSGYDVVRVRILSALAEEGVLPLEEAAEYVYRAKEMMTAVACSVVSPKIYFAARKPTQANEFIRRVRFGQTQRGSFVFSLLSPIVPRLGDHSDDPALSDPFERQVSRMLLGAISQVKVAAAEAATTHVVDRFEQGARQGVSANLCSALAGLLGAEDAGHDIDVSLSFALVNPAGIPNQRQLLPRSLAPVLRSAAATLKAKAPQEEFELSGPVLELRREGDARTGSVVVTATLEGRTRGVTLELEGADYDAALEAHQRRTPLVAVGTLVKEGKSFRLKVPREVRAVRVED